MKYQLTKHSDTHHVQKHGIELDVYPQVGNCGFVLVKTQDGHNQEFYDVESTFIYVVIEGEGTFFLDDEEVKVEKGDMISIPPKTRIYYKGSMKLALFTNPPWKQENETETRKSIW